VKIEVRGQLLFFLAACLCLTPTTRGQSNKDDNPPWEYGSIPDKMTGKDTVYASLESSDGMYLSIEQQVPRYPVTAYIYFQEGNDRLFFCGHRECTVDIRFDHGKIESWSAHDASSGSAKVLHFADPEKLIGRLKKAHRIVIEVPVFEHGPMQFEFFVDGLIWPPPPSKSSDAKSASPNVSDKTIPAVVEGTGSPALCFYMPSPPYTQEARAAKFEGSVQVEGTVTVDGRIENIRIVKSPGLGLDEPIVQTMRTWRCKAASGPSGEPIPVTMSFQVGFHFY
jgi:TonB family protein